MCVYALSSEGDGVDEEEQEELRTSWSIGDRCDLTVPCIILLFESFGPSLYKVGFCI